MIHQYKSNGYNIVLDVNSGSVHVVDDIVYEMIPAVEKMLAEGIIKREDMLSQIIRMQGNKDENLLNEALEEILELKDAGMLFTEDIYENYIADFTNRETVVKALFRYRGGAVEL